VQECHSLNDLPHCGLSQNARSTFDFRQLWHGGKPGV